jgi:hypothetical protein
MYDFARLMALALAVSSTPACSRETGRGPGRDEARGATEPRSSEREMSGTNSAGGVAKLPYARGKTFLTLDEYLAHLERQGAMDLPYWREVEPGVYQRITSRVPAGPPERATRAELLRRFGFAR